MAVSDLVFQSARVEVIHFLLKNDLMTFLVHEVFLTKTKDIQLQVGQNLNRGGAYIIYMTGFRAKIRKRLKNFGSQCLSLTRFIPCPVFLVADDSRTKLIIIITSSYFRILAVQTLTFRLNLPPPERIKTTC